MVAMLSTVPRVERLVLPARTAEEVMTPNPMSLRAEATVAEAIAALTDHSFGAAPVIDEAGRPIGVLSQADLLGHDREHMTHMARHPDPFPMREGFGLEDVDGTLVADVMTPAVFAVLPDTPMPEVIDRMLALRVHHLFVVDEGGALIGVISPLDVLRNLRRELA